MGKWEPVDPADLKPGDEVKLVDLPAEGVRSYYKGTVARVTDDRVYLGDGDWFAYLTNPDSKWFHRKPKPPTRPVEPPAGTVVRKVSTGEIGVRSFHELCPWSIVRSGGVHAWDSWDDWIAPGDAIEVAEWVKP